MLHVFAFPDSNSGVTCRTFLKLLKLCVILTFEVKARHPYSNDDDDVLKTIEPVLG